MSKQPQPSRVIGLSLPLIPAEPLILPWHVLVSDNRRFFPSTTGEQRYTGEYLRAKAAMKQRAKLWWRAPKLEVECALVARFWFPDLRKRDSGNYRKALTDALTGAVYVDDQLITDERYVRMGLDRTNPRCEVTIALAAHLDIAA